jgi:opacity protein-like surface antigen
MIKKTFSIITLAAITLFSQSTFALFSKASAMDLDSFYITPKVGVSASKGTQEPRFTNASGNLKTYRSETLGRGHIVGVSVGKYVQDNIRLELEGLNRDHYKLDTTRTTDNKTLQADVNSTALFINSFYEFEPSSISNKSFVPYFGGGIGLSKNKLGTITRPNSSIGGKTVEELAYKLSAGTLFSLKENLSLDVAYQYVNLGKFKSSVAAFNSSGASQADLKEALNGGEIKSHEITIGLQYKF